MNNEIKTEDFFNAPKKKMTAKLIGIIVGIVILLVVLGFVLYFLVSAFTKKTVVDKPIRTDLNANDALVTELYSYVTYGRDGQNRNRTFINNKVVDVNNLANYDKIFFGTYFLNESDFYDTGEVQTDYKLPVYGVKFNVLDSAIRNYFGNDITYTKDGTYKVVLNFSINGYNYVELKYDSKLDAFTSLLGNSDESYTDVINDYYAKFSSAYSYGDKVVIKEKIIYPTYNVNNDVYNYKVYKDYNHTILLDEVINVNKETLTTTPIYIENYEDKANVITYTFKKGVSGKYNFVKSQIEE